MHTLSPALKTHLASFNGTIESLSSFFTAVTSEISERKETLRLSENRFTRLIDEANNGIALLNAQGLITYVTPAVLKTFGYTEEELLHNPNLDIGHPDDKSKIKEFLTAIMAKPYKKGEISYRVRTKAGEWRWVKSHVTNLLEEQGINSLVFNYEDITENVLLLEQRDFEKRNTEALINNTSDLMWSIDNKFRLITANRPFLRKIKVHYGIDLKTGDKIIDPMWVSEPDAQVWMSRYLRAMSGTSFTVSDHVEVTGRPQWEETTFYPIYERGEVIGVSCFLRDVTERKLAFETIRKNEALMAVAQDIAQFGSWEAVVATVGEELIIDHSLQWSDQLYKIFGLEPGKCKMTVQKFRSFVHPMDITLMSESIQRALKNKSAYEAEYRIIKPDGEVAWIRSVGRVVATESGEHFKIMGTAQDITTRKMYEQERTKLIQDLLQKNKDLEQFAYIVSHNLRAPVANILGLADVFKAYAHGDEIQVKCAEGMQRAAFRLDEVIKDMHEVLQVRKQFSEKKTCVDLKQLVDDVWESIRDYMTKQEGVIYCQVEECSSLFTVRGYLYSIFYNLILNSLKYRQPEVPPVISINSYCVRNNVVLVVSDNGIGIDMSRFGNKVFRLYERFHEHIEGRGVGLYMVKSQVEALGGTIEVKSELNTGTTFTITIPQ